MIDTNWGDALNPVLVSFLSQRPVQHSDALPPDAKDDVYSVIGSHLVKSQPNWVVWGTGIANIKRGLGVAPRMICAVRGPLTRKHLQEGNIDCPNVFGDPAVFYPAMYPAACKAKYELGIIQHIREVGIVSLPLHHDALSVKFINIGGPLTEVIDDIVRCRRIVSSSLHGIIASHSFGVPATWVKFSNLPKSDGFKFRDYWASVGCFDVSPFHVTQETTAMDLALLRSPIARALDTEALLEVCPFVDEQRRHEISNLMRGNYRMHEIVGIA